LVPQPTHGVLGQIEGQPALRGQPPGERVSGVGRGIGVGANIYPVTGFGLPLHGPAGRVSPLEAVEKIAPDVLGPSSGRYQGCGRTVPDSPVCTGDLSSIMAFDEGLAERMRDLLGPAPGLSERKMFGGLCFLLRGNMSFGVVGSELMVRVGPDAYTQALGLPHAREMDFTGRSMRGMVFVSENGISEDEDLEDWLQRGMAFAGSLPPK
jgi:hypothetical protein